MTATITNLAAWRQAHPQPLQPDLVALALLPCLVWHAAWAGYCQAFLAVVEPRGGGDYA